MISRASILNLRELGYSQREAVNPVEIKILATGAPNDVIVAAGTNFSSGNNALVDGGLLAESDVSFRVLTSRLPGFTPAAGHKLQWRKQGETAWRFARIEKVTEPDASPFWTLRCVNVNK